MDTLYGTIKTQRHNDFMIPQFPEFKKLELSDKDQIESFTKRFPPYSDFNFVSMFSWDIHGDMRVSILNDNLVVRFNDYITGKPFYSFLGVNKVNETTEALLDYSLLFGGGHDLKLIPEVAIKDLDKNSFSVIEDRDHFDYIIPAELFKEYNTKQTRTKKNSVNQFLSNFTPVKQTLDLDNVEVRDLVYELFTKWSEGKEDPLSVQNELQAIKRFVENNKEDSDHIFTGIFLDEKMISFCLSERLNDGFSNIHFCKADTSISTGVYAHILQENAKILIDKGHNYINIEQDLGIDSLRKWKMSHGAGMFLKKYIVSFNDSSI